MYKQFLDNYDNLMARPSPRLRPLIIIMKGKSDLFQFYFSFHFRYITIYAVFVLNAPEANCLYGSMLKFRFVHFSCQQCRDNELQSKAVEVGLRWQHNFE
jgi:hypothetical protein